MFKGRFAIPILGTFFLGGCDWFTALEPYDRCDDLIVKTVNRGEESYGTIKIDNQWWLMRNLNVDLQDHDEYCPGGDEDNCKVYGKLYDWYTANNEEDPACPAGWHLPAFSDLETLLAAVGNDGSKLLDVGQGIGKNTSCFSALLAGARKDGSFVELGEAAYFWSSTEFSSGAAYFMKLKKDGTVSIGDATTKANAYSIRCIKSP